MNFLNQGKETSSNCSKDVRSEMKDMFQEPIFRKPTPTRKRCFEQFLMQEFFEKSVRRCDTLRNLPQKEGNSEYYDKYCKHVPQEDQVAKEALITKYPLHCTRAITLYNQNGALTKDFKRSYSISRPVFQQKEQFG